MLFVSGKSGHVLKVGGISGGTNLTEGSAAQLTINKNGIINKIFFMV